MSDSSCQTIRDEWCKDCMRRDCTQTVEECKNTPPVTVEQIYQAMIKCAEKYHSSHTTIKEEE